ncbi:MAG: DUF4169 family protein [Minwuia sp.]|nr:DUF4169 family protein [Minwuia sp.]
MVELINLRRARKNRDRKAKADQAAENRVIFGRTGAERQRQSAEDEQRRHLLDGKRMTDTNRDRTDS